MSLDMVTHGNSFALGAINRVCARLNRVSAEELGCHRPFF